MPIDNIQTSLASAAMVLQPADVCPPHNHQSDQAAGQVPRESNLPSSEFFTGHRRVPRSLGFLSIKSEGALTSFPLSMNLPADALSRNDPQLKQIVHDVRHQLRRNDIRRYGAKSLSHPWRKPLPESLHEFSQWADSRHAKHLRSVLSNNAPGNANSAVQHARIRANNLKCLGHPDATNLIRGIADSLNVNLRVVVKAESEWRSYYPKPFDKSLETIDISYVPVERTEEWIASAKDEMFGSAEFKLKTWGLRECLIEHSNDSVFEAFSRGLREAGVYRFPDSAPCLVRGTRVPNYSDDFREAVFDMAVRADVARQFGPHFAPCAIDRWQTIHDERLLKVMADGFDVNVVLISESFDVELDRVTRFCPNRDTVFMVERFDDSGRPHYNTAKFFDGVFETRCERTGEIYAEQLKPGE